MLTLSAIAAVALCFRRSHLLRRRNGHRALNRRGDTLDVRDELRVQAHVEAICASGTDGVDDHAEDSESGALDVGRLGLTRDVTASIVDWSACAFFSTGRTLVSTNLATFTVSLAAVARACSTLVINALICFLLSRPVTPGARIYWFSESLDIAPLDMRSVRRTGGYVLTP